MCKRILIALTILQMVFSIKGNDSNADEKKVVCYYGGLTAKEMKNLYPEDIDASVCTHIIYMYSHVHTESVEIKLSPIFEPHQTSTGYVERLVKLKERNPELKLLLFVSPENIPWVLESDERKTKIIKSAIALLNTTSFDGFDFATSSFRDNLDGIAKFLCEMRAEFDKYGFTVSSVLSYNQSITLDPTVEEISRCSSFLTIVTIEHWTVEGNTTKLLAPMNKTRARVNNYIEKGFPANKLMITIPTFGLIASLADPKQTGLGAPVDGPMINGTQYTDPYTAFYGTLAQLLNDTTYGWTVVRDDDDEAESPYAYSKTGEWMTYDDPISAAAKARYVQENNLGGILIFNLEMDDFDGVSGTTFPIIRAISDTFKQGVPASNETS